MAKLMLTGADMNSQRVVNVGAPASASDATTKTYVDNLVAGLSYKDEVKAATTAALPAVTYANGASGVGATLTANANGAMAAVDGEAAPALNDRYLIKNQVAGLQNGLFYVSQAGTGGTPFILTRVTDADTTAELNNATVYVTSGTVNAGREYTQTTVNPVIGTDAIAFAQKTSGTSYTASLGVTLSGTDFRLASGVSGAGLTLTAGVLDVVATDTSLTVAADSVGINLAANSGLAISSGLKLASTVSGAGLTLTSGVLDVVATDTSLTVAADSVGINLASNSGLAISSGLKLASSVAGTGLVYTLGVLSVDRSKVPNVFNVDIGDGSSTTLTVTHNLNTRSVTYSIRRKSDDVFVDADVKCNTSSPTNALDITFPSAPSASQYNVTVTG